MKPPCAWISATSAICLAVVTISGCKQKQLPGAPSEESENTHERAETERDQAQEALEKRALREQRRLEAERQELERLAEEELKNEQLARNLEMKRQEVRQKARGRELGDFTSLSGKTYSKAVIKEIDGVGITVTHAAGASRIPFEDLPTTMQDEFLYSNKEKKLVIAKEAQIRQQYHQSLQQHQATTPPKKTDHPRPH